MNYSTRIFNYIDEVPNLVWESLSIANNVYFSKGYLNAFEVNNSNRIQFFYLVVYNKEKPISIAVIQVLEFDFFQVDFTSNANAFVQKASSWLGRLMKRDYVKIMICGNVFLSGEHGIYIKPKEDKKLVIEELIKGVQAIINANKYLEKWVDIILLKDIITKSLPIANNLKTYNYSPVQVDPNMVLTLDSSWKNFEDYLNSFKSKYRVKAKKAYKTSEGLIVKDFTSEDIKTHKKELENLYYNVKNKSSFNPETLNIATYISLKEVLGNDFLLRGYFLEDKLVGFMSGVVNKTSLDAHYVGIDYELNKQNAIYSRMLYDYVRIGIDRRLKRINFGRTSGEIKSTLGAVPEELTCYVRHKKSIANFLFKPFLRKIKPAVFEQRNPFKKVK
ncbi:peptidogalycan biosysnthesis protein [Flavobacteriaceae bacterium]|nr:peptidogalycan biosysnthesis protein [Flavobacteriaceae bacterium]